MGTVCCVLCGGQLVCSGLDTYQCQGCGTVYPGQQLREFQKKAAAEDPCWEYCLQAGSAILVRWLDDRSEAVVPDTLMGFPVYGLDKGAFYEKKKLLRVSLPATLTSIGRMAFCKCFLLEEIQVPQTLRSIGSDAFTNCLSLRHFTFPQALECLESAAFSGCRLLEEALLPPGLSSVPLLAFCGCCQLQHVTLSSQLQEIGDSAFCGCSSLTQLYLPASLKRIGTMAFWGCHRLKTLWVPPSVSQIGELAFGTPTASPTLLQVLPDSFAEIWARSHGQPYELLESPPL